MKKLSLEKMEMVIGGDCFQEAIDMFEAWDNYLADSSTTNHAIYIWRTGQFANCIQQ